MFEHLLEEVGVVAKGVEFQRPPRLLLDAGVFLGREKGGEYLFYLCCHVALHLTLTRTTYIHRVHPS